MQEVKEGQCSTQYLNDLPVKYGLEDDKAYFEETKTLEKETLGAHSSNFVVPELPKGMQNGPKILSTNLTEDAKEWLFKLEEALKNEDYIELSGIAFDATCEDEIEN